MLLYFLMAVALTGSRVYAQEMDNDDDDVMVSNNTAECATSLINWCLNMTYPSEGGSMSMVANDFRTSDGYYRTLCITDSDGTNCTRNGQPWFSCSPDHVFSFQGQPVTDPNSVADGVCETADRAFNDLFVQNWGVQNISVKVDEILNKEFESFFKQMVQMQEQIEQLNKYISGGNFPFGGNGSPFGNNFPFGGNGSPFGNNFPFGNRYPRGDGELTTLESGVGEIEMEKKR